MSNSCSEFKFSYTSILEIPMVSFIRLRTPLFKLSETPRNIHFMPLDFAKCIKFEQIKY